MLNLNLGRSQSRKKGKICLDQSLIDTHPFPSLLHKIFASISAVKKIFLRRKSVGGGGALTPYPPNVHL